MQFRVMHDVSIYMLRIIFQNLNIIDAHTIFEPHRHKFTSERI